MTTSFPLPRPVVLVGLLLFGASASFAAPGPLAREGAGAGEEGLTARLLATPSEAPFELREVPGLGTLELERFEVFAPDAEIVVFGAGGERRLRRPDVAYFRGQVAGDPSSTAVLSAGRDGIRGLVTSREGHWVVGRGARARAPEAQLLAIPVDPSSYAADAAAFSCGAEELEPAPRLPDLGATLAPSTLAARSTAAPAHTARLAIETDYEYFQRFPNGVAAVDYAGDLVAYASTIYSRDVGTSLVIGSMNLRTTPADPWVETSPSCGLFAFGKYWNDNYGAVDRSLAHFLSGKSTNAGVAWIGVLCSGPFAWNLGNPSGCASVTGTSNFGGGYGYTSGIDGNFDLDEPAVIWDLLAVAHEIGHNFDSPHTHCYNGLGGSASPVDQCYNGQASQGCYSGTESLPGPAGAGSGTIMSYCHLHSGAMGNVSLTFGANVAETVIHPYGVQPQRVSRRMRDHVAARAATNPSCLAPVVPGAIFTDDFESGTATRWSG